MTTVAQVRAALADVTDPEIPVLTIEDLGVLRDVQVDGDRVVVTVTPTWSGCPAMDEIRADVARALAEFGEVEVRTVLSPPWTTDAMSEAGRERLRAYGIAPPARGPVALGLPRRRPEVVCPQCGSDDVEELSRFGSTSCKALERCRTCREPFERFKEH